MASVILMHQSGSLLPSKYFVSMIRVVTFELVWFGRNSLVVPWTGII